MTDEDKLSPEENHERGVALLESGLVHEAFGHLKLAHTQQVDHPGYLSSYGLAMVLATGDVEAGLEAAETAARRDLENPMVFVNLARIHIAPKISDAAFP